jgi:transglutaminase-like putative cysteine protease
VKKSVLFITSYFLTMGFTVAGVQPAFAENIQGLANSSGYRTVQAPPNSATDDSEFWRRAGKDIYIEACSYPFYMDNATSGPALLKAEPGDPIYLTVASSTKNIDPTPIWFVNSPYATISPVCDYEFSRGGYRVGVGTFTATKPGIYTVQAESGGEYSMPLVLLVGLDKLTASRNLAVSGKTYGIQPLPRNLPSVPSRTQNGITYKPYRPINGWLPVSGYVKGADSVVVYLWSGNSDWSYCLPVHNGQFSGLVRIPFTGNDVKVLICTNFNQSLTQHGRIPSGAIYDVSNSVPISRLDKARLASAEMDVNMLPDFAREASILMDNSPTTKTGIVAISNFAAEKVQYDWPTYLSGKSLWCDSATLWNKPIGVCQDIAALAATMMKSIGIPVETVVGAAPKGPQQNHEWLQAYDGSSWIILDPTWDSPTSEQDMTKDVLSNEYNDNSLDFQTSHTYMGLGGWK